ncbi:hypothetical protein C2S52_000954 [Perilla frutescens var. hirtella]|nr:hypothetical protein C2S52_000954 [Perilla frutescens var. hirtella]
MRVEAVETDVQGLRSEVAEIRTTVDSITSGMAAMQKELSKLAALFMSRWPPDGHPSPSINTAASSATLATPGATTILIPEAAAPAPAPAPVAAPGRVELPQFDGADPRAWLARAEQFFMIYQTPFSARVEQALVVMAGDALYWIHWVLRHSPTISWAQFSSELLFIAQVTNLEEQHYLGQFLIGLKPEIRVRIREDTIADVYAAIRWSGQIERELLFMSGDHADSGQGRSLPISAAGPTSGDPTNFSSLRGVALQATGVQNRPVSLPQSAQSGYSSASSTSTPPRARQVRHLTPADTREHRAKGLCYRCSQPWGPSHVCAQASLSVLLAGTEEGREDSRIESGELDPARHDISTDFVPATIELQHLQFGT